MHSRTLARLVLPECALVFAVASVVFGGCGSGGDSNGELKLGDSATIGDERVTVKTVAHGLSECEQQLALPTPERWPITTETKGLTIKAGYTATCLEYDWEFAAEQEVGTEGPTATPGQRYQAILLDSAGEEHEAEARILTFHLGTTVPASTMNMKAVFAIPEGLRAVAFVFRDSETGEEARWSLE
jgi:hypothetical protein